MLNLKALQAEAYKKGQIAAYTDCSSKGGMAGIVRGYAKDKADELSGLEQHNGQ